MFRTASHWTPLLRLWASELEIDVNMMLPIDVPRAMSMSTSGGKFCRAERKDEHGHDDDAPAHAEKPGQNARNSPEQTVNNQ